MTARNEASGRDLGSPADPAGQTLVRTPGRQFCLTSPASGAMLRWPHKVAVLSMNYGRITTEIGNKSWVWRKQGARKDHR